MPGRLGDLARVMDAALGAVADHEAAARAPRLVRDHVRGLGLPATLTEVSREAIKRLLTLAA